MTKPKVIKTCLCKIQTDMSNSRVLVYTEDRSFMVEFNNEYANALIREHKWKPLTKVFHDVQLLSDGHIVIFGEPQQLDW